MKKSSEDINGGPIFGTGMFDSDGMMAVYLRRPIGDSNPNKAHREAIALIKEVLTEALNYVDQENNISIYANVCCKEAATALKDCLRDLEHL
jgi:hypothetical protein